MHFEEYDDYGDDFGMDRNNNLPSETGYRQQHIRGSGLRGLTGDRGFGDRIPSSSRRGRKRGGGGGDSKRKKRFYGAAAILPEVGCVKGVVCCEIPQCRPYCSLCNDYDGNIIFITFLL